MFIFLVKIYLRYSNLTFIKIESVYIGINRCSRIGSSIFYFEIFYDSHDFSTNTLLMYCIKKTCSHIDHICCTMLHLDLCIPKYNIKRKTNKTNSLTQHFYSLKLNLIDYGEVNCNSIVWAVSNSLTLTGKLQYALRSIYERIALQHPSKEHQDSFIQLCHIYKIVYKRPIFNRNILNEFKSH